MTKQPTRRSPYASGSADVRRLIAIAEAPREGKPIWEYNPDAAGDYALVLAEVCRRCGL